MRPPPSIFQLVSIMVSWLWAMCMDWFTRSVLAYAMPQPSSKESNCEAHYVNVFITNLQFVHKIDKSSSTFGNSLV